MTDSAALMTIRSLTPRITVFSQPFSRFGKIHFGMRATCVQLQSGSLAIFSPTPLTSNVRSTIDGLGGNVRYLVAPDIEHHMHLSAWKQAYPQAMVMGPSGLQQKREKSGKTDTSPFAHVWHARNKRTYEGKFGSLPAEFAEEFDVEYFHTHGNKDIAFLHKRDGGTLIEADLLFNLPAKEQYAASDIDPSSGILTKIAMYFTSLPPNNAEALGQKRFNWWALGSKDRKAYAESAKVVSGWQFERIIPCHGDVIEKDAKKIWDNVYGWFLDVKT